MTLVPARGLPPPSDRFARLEVDERIRSMRLRGLRPNEIARAAGVPLGYVTACLKRFEREYKRQADLDARAAASIYRREMVDRLERLRAEAWAQIELAKDEKRKTKQQLLKDASGATTHQRVQIEKIPGETTPSLIGEIRNIELALGQLHGVEIGEPPTPPTPTVGRDLIVITPAQPLDLARMELLNEAIRKRANGNAIDVPSYVVGGNGNGNGNGAPS